MYCLQVRRRKIGVPPRHLQRGMPKHLLQMEYRAAAPKIVHSEYVTECVEGETWRSESEFPAEHFKSRKTFPRPNFVWGRLAKSRWSEVPPNSLQERTIAFRSSKLKGITRFLRPLPSKVISRFSKLISDIRNVSASEIRQPMSSRNSVIKWGRS
jgi:hypothetical protein